VIVADTSVLSEPLRRDPNPRVLAWLDDAEEDVVITSVSVAELLYGSTRLPEGQRRTDLTLVIERLITSAAERILGFDAGSARAYASLRVDRERAGKPVSVEDLMIGSICLANGLPIATRNVKEFAGFGLRVINPWDSSNDES
jgi:toxin FitB